jgi:farnesyl-diphosphate farnesyltransferase
MMDTAAIEDRSFCTDVLPEVSRTFALSIAALPPNLRAAIEAAYLLCRIADTIEDDRALPAAVREKLFDAFEDALSDARASALERLTAQHRLGRGTDSSRLCTGTSQVFRCFHALPGSQRAAIRPHVAELARGMREFAQDDRRTLRDVAELERYCYFVAGTVGKLLTALFETEVPDLDESTLRFVRARSVSFGIGLQLVNIVKDVAEDFERGDCFLPADLARRHGVPLGELLERRHRDRALRVVRDVCDLARGHLRNACAYTLSWPAPQASEIRMFCAVPLALALATLDEVEKGEDTLARGATPKVTRAFVVRIFAEARSAVRSDDQLRSMFDGLARGAA